MYTNTRSAFKKTAQFYKIDSTIKPTMIHQSIACSCASQQNQAKFDPQPPYQLFPHTCFTSNYPLPIYIFNPTKQNLFGDNNNRKKMKPLQQTSGFEIERARAKI
jgi:hypothetical protein